MSSSTCGFTLAAGADANPSVGSDRHPETFSPSIASLPPDPVKTSSSLDSGETSHAVSPTENSSGGDDKTPSGSAAPRLGSVSPSARSTEAASSSIANGDILPRGEEVSRFSSNGNDQDDEEDGCCQKKRGDVSSGDNFRNDHNGNDNVVDKSGNPIRDSKTASSFEARMESSDDEDANEDDDDDDDDDLNNSLVVNMEIPETNDSATDVDSHGEASVTLSVPKPSPSFTEPCTLTSSSLQQQQQSRSPAAATTTAPSTALSPSFLSSSSSKHQLPPVSSSSSPMSSSSSSTSSVLSPSPSSLPLSTSSSLPSSPLSLASAMSTSAASITQTFPTVKTQVGGRGHVASSSFSQAMTSISQGPTTPRPQAAPTAAQKPELGFRASSDQPTVIVTPGGLGSVRRARRPSVFGRPPSEIGAAVCCYAGPNGFIISSFR
ncbi:hypothetical protein PoB_007109500 [Plakobranchus ocellatus]|uniref:Uncharacterized protein n=1 Tax=Plakobranchus ocellatus TaxID=259542 RepID=A0AAV4DKB8_9GAST|nr:hypothetical protein PoB_007109500 [Plakobranchus ocellatus]